MKKFYGACVALLLGLLLALAGCSSGESKVFAYLKAQQNFVGNPTYNGGNYTASFTVNEDLSYTITVSDNYDAALKNYSAEGTQMEYLGCNEKSYESESWGITSHWTVYTHVIKLPEAKVDGKEIPLVFYLLAESNSKRADTFTLMLIKANAEYGESDISNIGTSFNSGYALKKA